MRPKKVILCINPVEQELSVTKFMLSTNGYRVYGAGSASEAIELFSGLQVDLVLAEFSVSQTGGKQLLERLKRTAPQVPMILLADAQAMNGEIHVADAVLAKKNCTTQELLERIKAMSARKRGPRKGGPRPVHIEELAAAS